MGNRKPVHENEIFRHFHCRLSMDKCSEICNVSVTQIKKWDKGKPIPEHYKRLMAIYGGYDLSHLGWKNWQFENGYLRTPMGFKIKPEMIEYWCAMYSPDVENRPSELERLRAKRRAR